MIKEVYALFHYPLSATVRRLRTSACGRFLLHLTFCDEAFLYESIPLAYHDTREQIKSITNSSQIPN